MEGKPADKGEEGVLDEGGRTADGDEERLVTIKEYVEGLEAQELEVDMILGGDDGKDCTYSKGYLPRQAVFSCISCCPDGNAGVCNACSMSCHDGHEVIEIWTRRHFRCDCGNSKFGIGVCKLYSGKDPENNENMYNKNYKGVYCFCNRPYPDPEGNEDMGEMLQCCICEDWFHEVHLGLAPTEEVPKDEEGEPLFDELICQSCAASLEFLSHYRGSLVPVSKVGSLNCMEDTPAEALADPVITGNKVSLEEIGAVCETGDVDPKVGRSDPHKAIGCQQEQASLPEDTHLGKALANGGAMNNNGTASVDVSFLAPRAVSGESSASAQKCKLVLDHDTTKCGDGGSASSNPWTTKALFLVKSWRSELCRCNACLGMYKEKGVSFLMDSEDTIAKYEEVAKEKRKEKMDASNGQDLTFLNNLGHVGKMEFLHGLNEMTTELSAFLASHESAEAITSADVYEFFDNLKKKRARRE